MTEEKILNLAIATSIRLWNFDIVKFVFKEDKWYYFICTSNNRPRWSSLPIGLKINEKGDIKTIYDLSLRMKLKSKILEKE